MKRTFHDNVVPLRPKPVIPFAALIDLLTPGIVACRYDILGDGDGVDLKLAQMGTTLVLTAKDDRISPRGTTISWVIATGPELEDGSYKEHFKPRIISALERLNKEIGQQ